MTAAVLYGREDLKIETVDIPHLADDDVLVRVEVALTCEDDIVVPEEKLVGIENVPLPFLGIVYPQWVSRFGSGTGSCYKALDQSGRGAAKPALVGRARR